MKNAVRALNSTLISLLLSTSFLAACSNGNNSVKLQEGAPNTPGNPSNPGEKPGTSPTPSPTPGNPGNPGVTPTPIPKPAARVARFLCETSPADKWTSLTTLRGDAVSRFVMTSLRPTSDGQKTAVKSVVPLQSNGELVTFLVRGQVDDLTPWRIYKATGNILDTSAPMQVLSKYEGAPPKGGFAYENLNLNRLIIAANVKRNAYVYPNDSGTYIWESLKGSRITLPFKADTSFNPTFIGGDDYLRFDKEKNNVIVEQIYSFNSKKTMSLPSPADSKDSQLAGYLNAAQNTIFWIEGRPQTSWKLRMMGIGSSKASTIATLPGTASAIRLPAVFADDRGETLLAYNEEQTTYDARTDSYTLKSGLIHLITVSAKQGKVTSQKSFGYSDEIVMGADPKAIGKGVLSGLLFEPISGQLFASNLAGGGLVSFNLETNSWETHAMYGSAFGCYNPEWGIEVTNE